MSLSTLFLPLIIVLFGVPLWLGTRKQKKAMQQQKDMLSALSFGDRVMTTSGLHATIVSTTEETIDLEIAPGVVTTWLRAAVRERLAEPTVYDDSDESDFDTEDADTDAHLDIDARVDDEAKSHEVADAIPAAESTTKAN